MNRRRLKYLRGPLGYSVLLDGAPIGSLKQRGFAGEWQVSIVGFRPGNGDGKSHTFDTRHEAKRAILMHVRGWVPA